MMSITELMERLDEHYRAINNDIMCMKDDIEECRNDAFEYGEGSEYVANHLFILNTTFQRIRREVSEAVSEIEAINDIEKTIHAEKTEEQLSVPTKQNKVEKYEVVTIFDRPVLFTNLRIPREDVPNGLYCYDIRHDDECSGRMVELKDFVLVNHWGTILSAKPFEPREYGGHIYSSEQGIVIEDEDYNYSGEAMSVSEYINRYDELEQEYSEQNKDLGMEMM